MNNTEHVRSAQPSEASSVPIAVRATIALIGVAAWFVTQSFLASRGFPEGIGDGLHIFLGPLTEWLAHHDHAANLLLVVTSAVIDLLGCYLLFSGVMGSTVRPLLGLLLLFALRQVCQALIALPPPPTMLWRDPGVPSLFVTYQTGNDFFFSGHTAIAVYAALELSRYQLRWLKVTAVSIAAIEALTVLVLRAHYSMDVLTAMLAAICASSIAARLGDPCDTKLATWSIHSAIVTPWRKHHG
jgi:hypothetical protein